MFACPFDKLRERSDRLSQFEVVGEHVRQAGGVGQEMTYLDSLLAVPTEFGNEVRHAVSECQLTSLDQQHGSGGDNWLGNGSHEEDGILAQAPPL